MHVSIGKLASLSISLLVTVTIIATGTSLYLLHNHHSTLQARHAVEARDKVRNAALALSDQVRLHEGAPQLQVARAVPPDSSDATTAQGITDQRLSARQILAGMLHPDDRFVLLDERDVELLSVGNPDDISEFGTHQARIPETPWTLILYRPAPLIDSPLLGLAIFDTLMLLAIGLLAVATIRVILVRFRTDLTQLGTVMDAALVGRYRAPVTVATTDETADLLPRIEQLALKIRHQHERLDNHSLSDPLTGLFNRRYFDLMLAHLHEQSERQLPATLGVINLNDFDRVNAQHGREYGDRILQNIACYLLSRVRATDIVVRLGGDEFGLLLTNMAGETLADWLAALVHDYDHQALENGNGGSLFCQFSVGVAQIDAQVYPTPTAVFNAAHGTMLTAKQRRQASHSRYAIARIANVTALTPIREAQ